jgi:hypothetical protein
MAFIGNNAPAFNHVFLNLENMGRWRQIILKNGLISHRQFNNNGKRRGARFFYGKKYFIGG